MAGHGVMGLPAVICDTGTGVVKAGFAGEQEPSLTFDNLIGRPMLRYDQGLIEGRRINDLVIGEEASNLRAMLHLTRPVADGVIKNWDDMEAVWDFTFNSLKVDCTERHVVQTEAALNPRQNREKIVETMIEKYGFAGVNVSVQAIAALYSRGLTSGFVIDSGDGVTHMVPVTEGFLEPNLVKKEHLAGRHVTDELMKQLVSGGQPLNSSADFETVREMKQKLCYVALDLKQEKKLANETTVVDRQYTLPDSRTMRIGAERFLAPEILFSPQLFERSESDGIAGLCYDTIMKSDIHVRKDYFKHIVLSGGTTMFPGFSSRLEKDLRQFYLEKVLKGDKSRAAGFTCRVDDPPMRQHMVFQGCSIYANSTGENSKWWISKQEYLETGPSAVHRLIPTKMN